MLKTDGLCFAEILWDGGIYSNTPVEAVFDDDPRMSSVVFAVQIWHSRGLEPESIAQAFMREEDLLFGSRCRNHIARQAQIHRLRHAVRELVNMLPDERKYAPEIKELPPGSEPRCISWRSMPSRSTVRPMLDFDFSQAAIHARWQAGYAGFTPHRRGGPGMIWSIRQSVLPCRVPTCRADRSRSRLRGACGRSSPPDMQ